MSRRRGSAVLLLGAAVLAGAVAAAFQHGGAQHAPQGRRYLYAGLELSEPASPQDALYLQLRNKAETAGLEKLSVPHDFKFTDRQPESGITFTHHIVDDAGKSYKAVHYDHGNGIAAADVDGDGRIDLYFVNQRGPNGLWRNLGGGKFEDITERAGVGLANRIKATASFADIDNDGDQDLYVTTVNMGNVLFENQGNGTFKDITKEAGVGWTGHSSAAVFFDYDRDGLLDLLVCNIGRYTTAQKGPDGYFVGLADAFSGHLHPDRSERDILYKNLGHNRFRDVTDEVGLRDTGWSGDAMVVDFNNDGYPDLYILNMQGDDHYFENVNGKRFVDKTAAHFPKTPWGTMGVKSFDYNNDGRMDLLLTDMHSDMFFDIPRSEWPREKLKSKVPENAASYYTKSIWGNAFWENQGGGKFVECSDRLGVETYWPWGVSVGDLNADGFQDVFVTGGMNYPYRYAINSLLLNNRGQFFADVELPLGIEPRRGGKTIQPWFEVDCSGADRNHPDCKGRKGQCTVMGSLGSRSSVIFDLDDDGDLDIVTNEFDGPPQVLISDLAQKHAIHFVKVNLTGRKSNRNGLGAKVTITAGFKKMTQVQDGKSGYLSQSVLPLYFGLGDAARIDQVEVEWPSGAKQSLLGLPVNTVLNLVEP